MWCGVFANILKTQHHGCFFDLSILKWCFSFCSPYVVFPVGPVRLDLSLAFKVRFGQNPFYFGWLIILLILDSLVILLMLIFLASYFFIRTWKSLSFPYWLHPIHGIQMCLNFNLLKSLKLKLKTERLFYSFFKKNLLRMSLK